MMPTQQIRRQGDPKTAPTPQDLHTKVVKTPGTICDPLTSMNPSSVASSKDESGGDNAAALMVGR